MGAVADKLREARALIARGWCQKDYAMNAEGVGEWPTEPSCVSYCSVGALIAVCGGDYDLEHTLEQPIREVTGGGLISWNDNRKRTQAQVLAAFDKAIELAEAQS